MLQNLRNNLKGVVAVFVIMIFVVPLVVTGFIGSEMFFASGGQKAATVNGEDISITEFQRELQRTKNNMQQQFNLEADSPQLDEAVLSPEVIGRMVRRTAVVQEALDSGMDFSFDSIWEEIKQADAFKVDGKFDNRLFDSLVSNQRHTRATFLDEQRKNKVIGQLYAGIGQSAFVTEAELKQIAAIVQQKRDFFAITIPPMPEDDVSVTDEEIQEYYTENSVLYTNPETVKVEYIQLSLEQLAESIELSDDDVQAAYQQELASFNADPTYTVAHILIEEGDDADAKIQSVKEGLAADKPFEELAAEFSDDLGSKEAGGVLGELLEDAYPEEFVATAKTLGEGDISEPVKTEAGTHFIKLVSVTDVTPPTFEERESKIREELSLTAAQDKYFESLSELKDVTFGANDLSEAAKALDLPLQQSDYFSRVGGDGVAAHSAVLTAAFSDQVLKDGIASSVLELPGDKAIVIRALDHKEENLKPLDTVKEQIEKDLVFLKIEEASKVAAEKVVAELAEGSEPKAIAEASGYEFKQHDDVKKTNFELNRAMVQKAFSMPRPGSSSKPVVESTDNENGGAIVIGLTAVEDGALADMSEAQQTGIEGQLENQISQSEFAAFSEGIYRGAKVKIKN